MLVSRVLLVLCCLATTAIARAEEPRSPNVLVILTDDQGWGDLSETGNPVLRTPHIDSLAQDGASFDRFYVCPVCSPTRAEFLTGRYHPRGGVYSTSAGGERLDLDETTIADLFSRAGYTTGAFGKWHNGMQSPYHPLGRGFDTFYGFASGHWAQYFSPMLERDGEIVQGEGFVVDDFTDRAIAFMRTAKKEDRPFFAYLPLNTPHSPMQVPDRFWERYSGETVPLATGEGSRSLDAFTRAAYAMVENIDFNIGRLLEFLRTADLERETIVVYFHDNGPNGSRYNGGMKGRKGSTDEGGVRSPLLIRWPGRIPPGLTVEPIAAAIDLLPTLTDLCGVESKTEKPLDGVNLAPLLRERRGDWMPRVIFSHWRGKVSARTDRFRLDHQGNLYDMRADPGQTTDVSEEFPQEAERLRKAVVAWRGDVLSELKREKRIFPLGDPALKWTQIPARDGEAHGTIRRSNRFPNASYFENWTDSEDSVTWPIEVIEDGVFEVTMYYTAPESAVGSELELTFGKSRLKSRLAAAHTSAVVGPGADRVPRKESDTRNWGKMSLGKIRLSKGQGTLTLRAPNIAGDELGKFRLLMFERVKKD